MEVTSGLKAGDQVVTRANFLVDSESRLRASLAALAASSSGAARRLLPAPRHRRVHPPPPPATKATEPMIRAIIRFSAENRYLVIAATVVALLGAWWTMRNIPLDALPDLSDTQVIVYSRWDRSPDIIEDQVTYPIITALLGAPEGQGRPRLLATSASATSTSSSRTAPTSTGRARGCSSTCRKITPQLPPDVKVELGPDATSVGWVFQYALVDKHRQALARTSCAPTRTGSCATPSRACPGVAEVATVGGQVRQYQVTVNPNAPGRLRAVARRGDRARCARATTTWAAGCVELAGREYMVRGRGYVKSVADIEKHRAQRPRAARRCSIKDVATVTLGPEMRRGVADLDGEGDVVGGIVVMRQGENALEVIQRVKAKLEELKPSLPEGVEIVTTYDRSELIQRAIDTLTHELMRGDHHRLASIILLFLWHIPSAIVPIVTIPVSVLARVHPHVRDGAHANIMSLAGIAISIGVLVDGAIVEVENAYNKLHHWMRGGSEGRLPRGAAGGAAGGRARASSSRLLVIAVAFLPIFTLVDQEGRLFRPLAYSKNLAMAIAALLAITLDPAHAHARSRAWSPSTSGRAGSPAGDQRPASAPTTRGAAPDQPRCSTGSTSRPAASCCATPRRPSSVQRAARGHHHPRLPAPRPRVHAAAQRGHDPLHADGVPGMSVAEAQRLLQVQDRSSQLPRGRARLRQGGPRRHPDRPGAVLDDRDDRAS